MGRLLLVLLLTGLLASAQLKQRDEKSESTAALTEEDEDLLPQTEYVFNPIQAQKDIKIGDFYAKKGNHRAAVARYLEASRWNPGLGEAFWKLGQARDKLKQAALALDAYRKYLEIEPDGKQARDAKKRVTELEAQQEKLPMADRDHAPKEGTGTPGGADPSAVDPTKPPAEPANPQAETANPR